uniref:Uncharacterized protein n=1 Tax=Meloidogyne enterolobii TaxID=390850 RepID=A0A6V7XKS7_MELEN|nr:unnamed protein product [Meloidogyne enterolobii]
MTEGTTASKGVGHHHKDLHFDQIVNEIRDIQLIVDNLLFGSVFLRQPRGVSEGAVPKKPSDVPSLEEVSQQIDGTITHMHSLSGRLNELLENKDNECFEDQIDEYLRELEDSERTLAALKPMLNQENLTEGEIGKSDVSWLSWRRNTLGAKLHRESNELHSLIEGSENGDNIEKTAKNRLKTAEGLLKTADSLQRSAQYLSWFTTRVMEYNETLPEIEKDFTCSLVAQWVQEEVNKVQEHHKNCKNFCSELASKTEK